MDSNKRIVEIGGVKVEIDLRNAKVVNNYKVGDNVKLWKKSYGDSYSSNPGVMVGFDNFEMLPTLVIAYFSDSYNDPELKFEYLNKESKDVEICPMLSEELIITKDGALNKLEKAIQIKEKEIEDLNAKKEYF